MIKMLQKKFIFTSMTAITVLLLLLLGAINVANIVIVGNEMDATLRMISDNEGDEKNLLPRLESEPGTEPWMESEPGMEPWVENEPGTKPLPESEPKTMPWSGSEPGMESGEGSGPRLASEIAMPDFFANPPKNDYDTFLSSNFFVVRFDGKGEVVYVDVSRTSAVGEAEAVSLAREVYEKSKAGEDETAVTAEETLMRREEERRGKEGRMGKYRYRFAGARNMEDSIIVFLDTSNEMFSYIRVLFLSGGIGIICWALMLLFVTLLSKRAIRPIAENMERQKQFVTNAGHEIKTPLAIIQSNTEAMELYNGENKWSKNIKEQTARLSDLMQGLLMLSRMDEGGVKVEISRFSFTELLEEVLLEFAQPMEMKGICLEKEIQPDVFGQADKKQLEQVISILLDNAVKYTRPDASQEHESFGGKILVRLQKTGNGLLLLVENTCESLPQVSPEKLFDRFYRADEARARADRQNGGYGIGLSVAKSLVKANGGKIHAKYLWESNEIAFVVELKTVS